MSLVIKNLTKRFPSGNYSVNNFSYETEEKEFIVLTGSKGGGKTSIIRMIAGQEDITSGEIYIDGVLQNGLSANERSVGMYLKSSTLFPNLNVFENIEFSLKRLKVPKEQRAELILKAVETMNISDILLKMPDELTESEHRTVLAAKLLAKNPKIVLLDDPLVYIPFYAEGRLVDNFKYMFDVYDSIFIYLTNSWGKIMDIATKIIVVKDGAIIQVGTKEEILNKPVDTFVAGFAGDFPANLLNGKLVEEGAALYIEIEGVKFPVKNEAKEMLLNKGYAGKNVVVGIRQEDTCINTDGRGIRINSTELLKDYITLVIGDEKLHMLDKSITADNNTYVDFVGGDFMFFDADTEKNILIM